MINKNKARRVPKLRFKGFTDDWEQRKLVELSDRVKSYSISHEAEVREITGTKYIHYGDIHTGKLSRITDESKMPNIKDNDYISLNNGDIVVADASEDYKGIADACVLDLNKHKYKIVAGLHTIAFRPKKYLNSDFFFIFLHTSIFKHYGYKVGTGLKVFGITYSNLAKMPIKVPTYKEQSKISDLFNLIEKIIFLQQQKLKYINHLKRSIANELFKFSKIKIKGTYPVKNVKLRDISFIFIGLVTTMTKNYSKKGTLLIRNSNIKDNGFELSKPIYLSNSFAQRNKNRMMKVDDVVTVYTGDIGTSAVITEKEKDSIGFATITTRPNLKYLISNYLSDFLNTEHHKNWAIRMSTGDGRQNYNLKDFKRLIIPLPDKNIQFKISKLISNLNIESNDISLRIKMLKNIKLFLLQNMFI